MEAIQKLTVAPARILGLDKGRLKVGGDADLSLIDVDREQTVDATRFKSKSRNSPFHGWKLKGLAVLTVVSGRIVHRAPQS
jgi:dihydroorotase